MCSISFIIEQPPIPEKPSGEEEALQNQFKEVVPIVTEPRQEISIEIKASEPDFGPTIEIDSITDNLEAVEYLSLEIKNSDDVSVISTFKVPDQSQVVQNKVLVVVYPFEVDEVSLVWKHTQQYPLRFEGLSSFLNVGSSTIDLIALKRNIFSESGEEVFQVNSRTSSFQVRMTDTGRIH